MQMIVAGSSIMWYNKSINRYYEGCPDILDVWLFKLNVDIKDVVIQEEELESAEWVTKDELIKKCNQGIFDKNAYFDEVVNGEYDEVRKWNYCIS